MWIRSQDRAKLIDANEIHIELWADERSYVISDNFVLARYSTEQKALKVMDMIEDTILKCEAMRTGYAEYDFGAFVFDMPEDSEVEV